MKTLVALLLAGVCCAQSQYRAEAYGALGRSWIGDDEGSLGSGVSVTGTAGWRFTPRFGVEMNVDWYQHKREFTSATIEGNGVMVTGDFLYHFRGQSRVQPYVLFGGGLAHYVRESSFGPGPERSGNGGILNAATGLKIFVTDRWIIRPEWRIGLGRGFGSAFEPPLYYQRFSLGAGYRW